MTSAEITLTDHLISLPTNTPYASATTHSFLASAADGTLNKSLLALWLFQDRLYAAHAYPRFIGSLIANIPFSASHTLEPPEEALNQRILKLMVYCLNNSVREVGFFSDTAKQFDLDAVGWKERRGTRDYTAEMAKVAGSRRIEDGLVFLWAMEKIYLDAWTFVHKGLAVSASEPVKAFAENWTNAEFIKFVGELADLVNSLGITHGSEGWKRAEEIWERVVEIEEGFWPLEGEENIMKIGADRD